MLYPRLRCSFIQRSFRRTPSRFNVVLAMYSLVYIPILIMMSRPPFHAMKMQKDSFTTKRAYGYFINVANEKSRSGFGSKYTDSWRPNPLLGSPEICLKSTPRCETKGRTQASWNECVPVYQQKCIKTRNMHTLQEEAPLPFPTT